MDHEESPFLARMRDRKIVQWALAYLGVAWMLLQVVDVVGDKFLLSLAVQRGLIVVLAFGFLVTLVVAWYHGEKGRQRLSGGELWMIAALTVLAGAALRAVADDGDGTGSSPGGETSPAVQSAGTPPRSVAVLPFRDISAERDQEYLADGIAEELLIALSQVGDLSVVPRTSSFAFKDSTLDASTIGTRLGVATILDGTVRRDGNRLRVTASLIDVANGFNMWAERYDRGAADLLDVQEEIAGAIVDAFRIELAGPDVTVLGQTDEHEAQDLYLRGRFAWNRRDQASLDRAVELFQQALAIDPSYARAYVGLGDSYAVQGFWDYHPPSRVFPLAVEAAQRALDLEPRLAEAHATIAYAALYHDWDWSRAEAEFLRTIELAPTYPVGHQWYANFLTAMGRFEEASAAARRSSELDPLSMIAHVVIGWVAYYAHDFDTAIRQLRESHARDPDFLVGSLFLALSLEALGGHDEALKLLEGTVEMSGRGTIHVAGLAYVLASAGRTAEARELLQELEGSDQTRYVPPFELAGVYAILGDPDRAVALLERAHGERSHSMAFLRVDPKLAPLSDHPGYRRLLQEMGFP